MDLVSFSGGEYYAEYEHKRDRYKVDSLQGEYNYPYIGDSFARKIIL